MAAADECERFVARSVLRDGAWARRKSSRRAQSPAPRGHRVSHHAVCQSAQNSVRSFVNLEFWAKELLIATLSDAPTARRALLEEVRKEPPITGLFTRTDRACSHQVRFVAP